MRQIIKAILFLFTVLVTMAMMSCSAKWHFKKAYKKDPDLFKVDTVTRRIELAPVDMQSFSADILCKELKTINIQEPVTYIVDGKEYQDTIKASIVRDYATNQIQTTIDCPDPVVKYIPEPYPVEVPVKPKGWDLLRLLPWWVWLGVALLTISGFLKSMLK